MLKALVRPFSAGAARRAGAGDVDRALEELAALKAKTTPVDPQSAATAQLINTFRTKYNPKVMTEEVVAPGVGSPIPLSAEMNYYAPLKHEVKHGHLKAELVFKAFDPVNVEFFSDFALRAAYYLGLPATGATPIPTKRERWTVIRAPFVMAKTKENFERKTHGRIVKIWDANPEVVDLLLAYLKKNSVWGVGLKVNLFTSEAVGTSGRKIESQKVLSELETTLSGLQNEQENPVAQKVLELLSDPVFARHLSKEEVEKITKAN